MSFYFYLFSNLLSLYKSNLVKDISSRLRISGSSLRRSFMGLVLGIIKFSHRRKKWQVDSISKSLPHKCQQH